MPSPPITPLPPTSTAQPAPPPEAHDDVDLSCESVAGEEDPGASLDLGFVTAASPPANSQKVPE